MLLGLAVLPYNLREALASSGRVLLIREILFYALNGTSDLFGPPAITPAKVDRASAGASTCIPRAQIGVCM